MFTSGRQRQWTQRGAPFPCECRKFPAWSGEGLNVWQVMQRRLLPLRRTNRATSELWRCGRGLGARRGVLEGVPVAGFSPCASGDTLGEPTRIVTENPLAPHLGVPRGVSMVSLGIPLPPDPAPEDWTPLSRATRSQLKALFGADAPRAAGGLPRAEMILVHLSSRTKSEVTQSSVPFPATVPFSGSSVVTLVKYSRA